MKYFIYKIFSFIMTPFLESLYTHPETLTPEQVKKLLHQNKRLKNALRLNLKAARRYEQLLCADIFVSKTVFGRLKLHIRLYQHIRDTRRFFIKACHLRNLDYKLKIKTSPKFIGKELRVALRKEDYIRAAALRDDLKTLQNSQYANA